MFEIPEDIEDADYGKRYVITVILRNLDRSYGSAVDFVAPSIEPRNSLAAYHTTWGTEDDYCYIVPRRFLTVGPISSFPIEAATTSCLELEKSRQKIADEASPQHSDLESVPSIAIESDPAAEYVEEVLTEFGDESTSDSNDECEDKRSHEDYVEGVQSTFFNYLMMQAEGRVNPVTPDYNCNFQPAQPPLHHLNFALQPTSYRSATPPAVSMWATTSYNVRHHEHRIEDIGGFTRKSILSAQAAKYIDPYFYHGPSRMLHEYCGSRLEEAVSGLVTKTYLPYGTWPQQEGPQHGDTTRAILPSWSHWSNLTTPVWYLTPSFVICEPNGCGDHAIPAVPWAKHSHSAKWNPQRRLKRTGEIWKPAGSSNLRIMEVVDYGDNESHDDSSSESDKDSIFSADERAVETPDITEETESEDATETGCLSDKPGVCSEKDERSEGDSCSVLPARKDDSTEDCLSNKQDTCSEEDKRSEGDSCSVSQVCEQEFVEERKLEEEEPEEKKPEEKKSEEKKLVECEEETVGNQPKEEVNEPVAVGKWLIYGAIALYAGYCAWRRLH